MSESVLKKIDKYIAPIHISRSAFLQKLALKEIAAVLDVDIREFF